MTTPTVTIPFKDRFAGPMLNGKKTMTTRTRKYGKSGDVFHAFGGEFKIIGITRVRLWFVAEKFFEQEGVSSQQGFKRVWAEILPRRGFDPDQKVYLHRFEYIAREQ